MEGAYNSAPPYLEEATSGFKEKHPSVLRSLLRNRGLKRYINKAVASWRGNMANGRGLSPAQVKRALARYERSLVTYAFRLTGDLEQARDIVQETFLRLCVASFERGGDELGRWLFRVCRNQAIDVLRKEGRTASLEEVETTHYPSPEPSPSAIAERREAVDQIMGFLDKLPKKQQEVVSLRFEQSMSYKEISETTGHSVSNVGFLIHTAIKAIRRQVHSATGFRQEA